MRPLHPKLPFKSPTPQRRSISQARQNTHLRERNTLREMVDKLNLQQAAYLYRLVKRVQLAHKTTRTTLSPTASSPTPPPIYPCTQEDHVKVTEDVGDGREETAPNYKEEFSFQLQSLQSFQHSLEMYVKKQQKEEEAIADMTFGNVQAGESGHPASSIPSFDDISSLDFLKNNLLSSLHSMPVVAVKKRTTRSKAVTGSEERKFKEFITVIPGKSSGCLSNETAPSDGDILLPFADRPAKPPRPLPKRDKSQKKSERGLRFESHRA